jgi:NADH-quinone oxidoreductase subunit E
MNRQESQAEKLLKTFPAEKSHLIHFLHLVQQELGFIPEEIVPLAAWHFSISPSEMFGVVTFYSAFKLKPGSRHEIVVCEGTACHVRGAEAIVNEFSRLLGIKPGEENAEKNISLKSVNCLGCCAIGPVVVVDGQYQAKVDLKWVRGFVAGCLGKDDER